MAKSRIMFVMALSPFMIATAMLAYSGAEQSDDRHVDSVRTDTAVGPIRFGTLNILGDERVMLHVDAYAPTDSRRPPEPCPIHVQFVSEEVVLQEGDFVLLANRTLDTAFYGITGSVVEVHPVITPTGPCNLDIVPLLQIEDKVAAGTGRTRYIYSGQFSVPLRVSRHH